MMQVSDTFLSLAPAAQIGFAAFLVAVLLLIVTQLTSLAVNRRRERMLILLGIQTELRALANGRDQEGREHSPGRFRGRGSMRPVRRTVMPRRVPAVRAPFVGLRGRS